MKKPSTIDRTINLIFFCWFFVCFWLLLSSNNINGKREIANFTTNFEQNCKSGKCEFTLEPKGKYEDYTQEFNSNVTKLFPFPVTPIRQILCIEITTDDGLDFGNFKFSLTNGQIILDSNSKQCVSFENQKIKEVNLEKSEILLKQLNKANKNAVDIGPNAKIISYVAFDNKLITFIIIFFCSAIGSVELLRLMTNALERLKVLLTKGEIMKK